MNIKGIKNILREVDKELMVLLYVELHFNYCLDTESDDYDDVEEEITGYCLSENWYELLEYGEDFYIWIHNDETEEEYVTEGVTL